MYQNQHLIANSYIDTLLQVAPTVFVCLHLRELFFLQDFFSTDVEIKPTDIITQVAKYFYITFDDIVGRSRTKKIALARQIAMYLVRELTSMSLNDIGQVFGGKDHTTVMHAYTRISDEMQEKQEIYNYVTELTLQLKQRSGEK